MTSITPEIEALAADIGEQIYIDVAKWHLFLAEAHLHTPLAERVYPLLAGDRLDKDSLGSILQELKVPIGGGKLNLSLGEVLPQTMVDRLWNLLQDYQQQNF